MQGEVDVWDKERVLAEIIARATTGESIARADVPSILRARARDLFGSYRAAVEVAGYQDDRVRQTRAYTREDVVALLRALARDRPDTSLTDLNMLGARPAMIRLFGSVRKATRAAGLGTWPTSRKTRWTKATLVAELRKLPAGTDGVIRLSSRLMRACEQQFGGVAAARAAAGLPVLRESLTKEQTIDALRAQFERGELAVHGSLETACHFHFDTIVRARKAAGLDAIIATWSMETLHRFLREHPRLLPPGVERMCVRYHGSTAEARITAGVMSRADQWSRSTALKMVRKCERRSNALPPSLQQACLKFFGTLEAARTIAGVSRRLSAEDLVRSLRADGIAPHVRVVARMFGITQAEVRPLVGRLLSDHDEWNVERAVVALRACVADGTEPSSRLAATLDHYFCDLATARRIAGVPAAPRRWSREVVLEGLRDLHARGQRAVPGDLAVACERYFGGIARARVEAGVPAT